MAERLDKLSTGVGKAYYSIIGEGGAYGVPKELNDIVSFSVAPSENTSKFFAGDRAIVIDQAVSVSGTLTVPAINNEQMIDLFGYKKNAKGELLFDANAIRPNIVLMIEQHLYGGVTDYITLWNCKVSLPSVQGDTKNDSVTFASKEISYEVLVPEDGVFMTVKSSDDVNFEAPDYAQPPVKVIA